MCDAHATCLVCFCFCLSPPKKLAQQRLSFECVLSRHCSLSSRENDDVNNVMRRRNYSWYFLNIDIMYRIFFWLDFFGRGFASGALFYHRRDKYRGRHCARTLSPYTVNAARIRFFFLLLLFFLLFFYSCCDCLWIMAKKLIASSAAAVVFFFFSLFFLCVLFSFILGHGRNYSIAWARFDQNLVQYCCCCNRKKGGPWRRSRWATSRFLAKTKTFS